MTTTEQRNKELVLRYLAAWEDKDPGALDDVLADGFTMTDRGLDGSEMTLDVDTMKQMVGAFGEAIPDLAIEEREVAAEADWVLVRIEMVGTHKGALFGIEPTGNRLRVEEFFSFRLQDGRIAEMHNILDVLGLLRQLDLELPAPA